MNCSEISCETCAPSLRLHQVQHQIQRRDPARAGEAVAVDAEELVAEVDTRKLLAQRREIFPVNRRAVAIQESRLGERIAAGAQGTEGHPPLGAAFERREELRRHTGLHIDAPAHEENVDRAERLKRDRGRQLQPVARRGRRALEAHDRPLVDRLAGEDVRHAQRLDRVRQRDHRVARQGQERELAAGQGHMPDFTPFLPDCDKIRPIGGVRAGTGPHRPRPLRFCFVLTFLQTAREPSQLQPRGPRGATRRGLHQLCP